MPNVFAILATVLNDKFLTPLLKLPPLSPTLDYVGLKMDECDFSEISKRLEASGMVQRDA
jgi:hypothetical protein